MKKYIILIITLYFVTSCSDKWLELTPIGSSSENIFYNEKGLNALLTGTYGVIHRSEGTTSGSASNDTFGSMASDDTYKGSNLGDQTPLNSIERWEVMTDNEYVRGKWHYVFQGVTRANEVLRILKLTTDIDPDKAIQIEAEAKFLRAFYNFQGYLVFKNIPIITEDTEEPEKVSNLEDIVPHIISDYKFAMDNLPANQASPGRPTKYAAMALAAKTHLFDNNYDAAKPLLDEIINSGKYSLMPSFHDNYKIATNNNHESIFEIQLSINDPSERHRGEYGMGYGYPQGGDIGTTSGFHQPSQNLVNAFKVDEAGLPLFDTFDDINLKNDMFIPSGDNFTPFENYVDPRLDWTVSRRGIPFLDWGVNRGNDWIRDQSNGGPYLPAMKFFFYKAERYVLSSRTGRGQNANNYRYCRYAHVLLWRAEVAIAENDLNYAEELVNMIRQRADNHVVMGRVYTYSLPNGFHDYENPNLIINWDEPAANYRVNTYPTGTFSSKGRDYALKAVQFETRLEFATEGHRFFDLRRWGIIAETLNAYARNDERTRTFMKGATFTPGKSEYMPIPQAEMDLQPGILVQNPGY